MDSYEVKKTPIKGVWELGKLEPNSININNDVGGSSADIRVVKLAIFLQLNYLDTSWLNPQQPNLSFFNDNQLNWHADGHILEDRCIPRKDSRINYGNMLIMVQGEDSTLFRRSNDSVWISEPYTIYFVKYDVVHASPLVNKPRHLSRLHLTGTGKRKIHPKIGRRRTLS